MKKGTLLLMMTLSLTVLFAQDQFLVYNVKGPVSVMENKASSKAKVGRMLPEDATVTVPANGAVTLICNQLSLITLNKPGAFKLSSLKEQCRDATPTSMSGNYIKYVWTQLTQKPGTPEKSRKMFMNNVGAVSRGINNIWIDTRLDTIYYVSGNFPLSWKSYAEAEAFDFMIFNNEKSTAPLFIITTQNKFVELKDIADKLQTGNTYYWTAAVKGEANEERKILIMSSKGAYEKLLQSWKYDEPAVENDAAMAFRYAFLLEQAHYLPAAYEHYKKAVQLQPEVTMYKTTLDAFKKDYNIK